MTETRTYTPDEYAAKMRVSVKTIYRQIRAGSLKAEKVGHQWRIVRLVATVPTVAAQPNRGQ